MFQQRHGWPGQARPQRFTNAIRYLKPFAFQPLAFHLARPPHRFGGFARAPFGRFFVMAAQLHFTKHALTLHFFLERLQRLIDIVVTNENLHLAAVSSLSRSTPDGRMP